jgi:hypothetical protein
MGTAIQRRVTRFPHVASEAKDKQRDHMGKKGRLRKPKHHRPGPSASESSVPPPVADPFRAEASAPETSSHEVVEAAPADADAPRTPPVTAEDLSVPPVADWDSAFFAESFDDLEPDPHAERRAIFAAAATRRAHLARYVVGAVAFSSVLCLVAMAKVALVGRGSDDGSAAAATVRGAVVDRMPSAPRTPDPVPPAPTAGTESAMAAPVDSAEGPPEPIRERAARQSESTPQVPDPSPPAADPSPATAAAASPQSSAPDPLASPGGAAEAAQEREACRVALERNRLADAVQAGERAVALDPADGEAWLVLGAAYQERGDASNARRCYRACLAEGRRGPRNECALMLH